MASNSEFQFDHQPNPAEVDPYRGQAAETVTQTVPETAAQGPTETSAQGPAEAVAHTSAETETQGHAEAVAHTSVETEAHGPAETAAQDVASQNDVEAGTVCEVTIDAQVNPAVNYALQQNGLPVVQSLALTNHTAADIEHVEVGISSNPPILQAYSLPIEFLPAGKEYETRVTGLQMDADLLAQLTERVTGYLEITVTAGGRELARQTSEITFLAYDEWHGYGCYPELLAAFVTPNHPQVTQVITRAADYLSQWTGDGSLDAYQTQDENRVLKQAAAVYAALQEQNIVYAVHPASYEEIGQRVRLCDAVMQQRLGNCLDLTLLYASCLEAIGLHPILVLQERHIFVGVWLVESNYADPVLTDASSVTKRLAAGVNELAVVESTMFTSGRDATFDEAAAEAERKLAGEYPVTCIIDIKRARQSGIRPLPLRMHDDTGWHVVKEERENVTGAPEREISSVDLSNISQTSRPGKIAQWERKLLDLGLRNTLINMRLSKSVIPIMTSSLDLLEDGLSDGRDYAVYPKPQDWHIKVEDIGFETMHDLGPFQDMIDGELQNRRLRSSLTESELSAAIKNLYRVSRASLEENGANTLFLALGLIRWYENSKSTKPRYAPIILVPVDIIRKFGGQGYVIRIREEEPHLNVTIFEKMRQDYGITVHGLDEIPQDEHGTDTRKVFTILRQTIMQQERWDVLESAYLGIFSFSQFVMWNDIVNRTEDLRRNKIVSSLIEGHRTWDAEPMEIGDMVPEDEVYLPLPADASQLYAIEAAAKGQSYVLHGPPGTGKSQTITAMIANALAQGRTVLFVAEKMAALEVVQKRLEDIGIGPFCLELHSNKSNKKAVLDQLRKASEVASADVAEEYARKAEQMNAARQGLNKYATELHKRRDCGLTFYEMIGYYEDVKDAADLAAGAFRAVDLSSPASLERLDEAVEVLIRAGKACGHPADSSLKAIGLTTYSWDLREEIPELLGTYAAALDEMQTADTAFVPAIGREPAGSRADLDLHMEAAEALLAWEYPLAWAKQDQPSNYLNTLTDIARHALKAQRIKADLDHVWNDLFYTQDGNALLYEFNAAMGKWFLPRMLGLNALSKRLAPCAKTTVIKEELDTHLKALIQYQKEMIEVNQYLPQYRVDLGDLYTGENTNWGQIITLASEASDLSAQMDAIYGTPALRKNGVGNAECRRAAEQYLAAGKALRKVSGEVMRRLQPVTDETSGWLQRQRAMCDDVTQHADALREWTRWNAAVAQARQAGLGAVVDHYMDRHAAPEDVVLAYRKGLYKALIVRTMGESAPLNEFSGTIFNEQIERFKRLDEEIMTLARKEIYCLLAARVPNFQREAAQSSEVGILQRAIRSGGRGVSIRKLFDSIPELLPRLCPCMLMSPMSAAQYLDPGRKLFDLVVFDEASQLQTCKAVGVLARGENAVIVGDPKQMPPTSFFMTTAVDEDNLDTEDLESVLDDCLAIPMPETNLLWHYRSRHESLIAFSNAQIYENRLSTFPSVNDRETKVRLVQVEGMFERGKNRQNRKEAEAVIDELRRRCHDASLSKYSVGIVTFNINQQNLIDDLLTEACASDKELERWAYEQKEPLFIKNLENVQGDERDVILFSIGYGPDEKGNVSMNLGPLNRKGGERRLNVAVSRSRCEMIVYTSLRPEDFRLSATNAEGVALLKRFIEYAGGKALSVDANSASREDAQTTGVAARISSMLQENGYVTDRNVGRSKYRVDIGVIDPDDKDRYILGIMLDGTSYGTSRTVRDREIAQQNVLRGLGWNILRIWSVDYWENSEREDQRILEEIRTLLANKGQNAVSEDAYAANRDRVTTSAEEGQKLAEEQSTEMPAAMVDAMATKTVPAAVHTTAAPVYSSAGVFKRYINAADFTDVSLVSDMRDTIQQVMQVEAPISQGLLIRRVAKAYGIDRAGSRIQNHVTLQCRALRIKRTTQDGVYYYWNQDQDPDAFAMLRASGDGDAKRESKDVPVQEAANAILYMLSQDISVDADSLVREAAAFLGYSRMGSAVAALFRSALQYALERDLAAQNAAGNYQLTQSGEEFAALVGKNVIVG